MADKFNLGIIIKGIKDQYNWQITDKAMSDLLGINSKTLNRWKKDPRKHRALGINIYMLLYLAAGEKYWGDMSSFLKNITEKKWVLAVDIENSEAIDILEKLLKTNQEEFEKRRENFHFNLANAEYATNEMLKKYFPSVLEMRVNCKEQDKENYDKNEYGGEFLPEVNEKNLTDKKSNMRDGRVFTPRDDDDVIDKKSCSIADENEKLYRLNNEKWRAEKNYEVRTQELVEYLEKRFFYEQYYYDLRMIEIDYWKADWKDYNKSTNFIAGVLKIYWCNKDNLYNQIDKIQKLVFYPNEVAILVSDNTWDSIADMQIKCEIPLVMTDLNKWMLIVKHEDELSDNIQKFILEQPIIRFVYRDIIPWL